MSTIAPLLNDGKLVLFIVAECTVGVQKEQRNGLFIPAGLS